jgi:hypothetical protein
MILPAAYQGYQFSYDMVCLSEVSASARGAKGKAWRGLSSGRHLIGVQSFLDPSMQHSRLRLKRGAKPRSAVIDFLPEKSFAVLKRHPSFSVTAGALAP